jgi:hypothetical protein
MSAVLLLAVTTVRPSCDTVSVVPTRRTVNVPCPVPIKPVDQPTSPADPGTRTSAVVVPRAAVYPSQAPANTSTWLLALTSAMPARVSSTTLLSQR